MFKKVISIISPVYNEAGALEEFVTRIAKTISEMKGRYDFEIILVNDASRDHSLKIMKDLARNDKHLRIIDLRRNFGQTYALQCGIDAAKGDIIISMDSDLQHFPEEIPKFVEKIEEGYDVVCGWRQDRKEGILRRWPSRVANKMLRAVSKINIHDFGTTYRAYRKDLIKELQLFGEFHRYIPALLGNMGCSITEIPIKNIERPQGKSNYGIKRTFGVFLDIILLYFLVRYMDRPLRVFGKIAMMIFSLGFIILAWLVVYAYTYNIQATQERIGWFILSILLFMSSLQILLTGIISEILTRIHFSLQDQKAYKIRNEFNKESLT